LKTPFNYFSSLLSRNNVLFKNFTSLSILQLSNYIIPFITFPYLVRILGPENFGLLNFAIISVSYFAIITDYGFHLSATQEISINRQNTEKINEIVSVVIFTKVFLFSVSAVVFFLFLFIIPKFCANYLLFLVSFISVMGNVLMVNWFFQGIEKMQFITIINIIVKVLYVISIFMLVKYQDDIILAAAINSIANLLIGTMSILFAINHFKIRIKIPQYVQIKHQLINGMYIFLSNVSISLYTITTPFILGFLSGDIAVGYYVAADKIRHAVQSMFSTFSQTIYPHSSYLFSKSKRQAINFLKKYLFFIVIISFVISLFVFLFAEDIVLIILGREYLRSILILKILAFLPTIIMLSNVFGIQTMLNTGFKKQFFLILFIAGIINIIILFFLIPKYSEIGAAISLLLVEIFVTSAFFAFLYYKRNKLLNE